MTGRPLRCCQLRQCLARTSSTTAESDGKFMIKILLRNKFLHVNLWGYFPLAYASVYATYLYMQFIIIFSQYPVRNACLLRFKPRTIPVRRLVDSCIFTFDVEETLVTSAFAICVLAYLRFYFGIVRGINILSAVTVEAVAQVHWVVRAVSVPRLTILTPRTTNWSLSLDIIKKVKGIYSFRLQAFSIYAAIFRKANSAYNESLLCVVI
jgi:hypothetical protein